MSFSATCSRRVRGPAGAALLVGVALLGLAGDAGAQGVTQAEALRLAFPGLAVERRTAYLDAGQLAAARQHAGVDIEQSVVTYYVAGRVGARAGVAYFDSHRVRTHGEVLMIVVGTDARVQRVEVLQFAEPPEYHPPDRWLALFEDRALTQDLSLKRGIPNMTGATLTSQAVTGAVRRVLALHRVIDPFGARE